MKSILDIFLSFFKLGLIAFGGPAAHVALMEKEFVEKRSWLDHKKFLDILGVTHLIPGPNSTEMAMHLGYYRGAYPGLLAAGAGFILPAATLTGLLAWFYSVYRTVPEIESLFWGIQAVVLAVILQAVFKLGQKAFKDWRDFILMVGAFTLYMFGFQEVFVILFAGILGLFWFQFSSTLNSVWILAASFIVNTGPATESTQSPTLQSLFLFFLKVGSILFGSGYVLIAFIEQELVVQKGWLTQQQLLDAVALGQFTPGPVLTTSTFIGGFLNGFEGAVVATLGLFLPSFVFVALLGPLLQKVQNLKWVKAFLRGATIGALTLMGAVLFKMGLGFYTNYKAVVISVVAALLIFFVKKVPVFVVFIIGAVSGYFLQLI